MVDPLVKVLREAQGYRQVLPAPFAGLHEQGRWRDRVREQHRQLRDEYQRLRERVLLGEIPSPGEMRATRRAL